MQCAQLERFPDDVHPEVMETAELHEEPQTPQVVGLIVVHCSLMHDVVLRQEKKSSCLYIQQHNNFAHVAAR